MGEGVWRAGGGGPSLSSPSASPEKIFSEVTPKCDKCQSLVKPGKQGRGAAGKWEVGPPHSCAHSFTPDLRTVLEKQCPPHPCPALPCSPLTPLSIRPIHRFSVCVSVPC